MILFIYLIFILALLIFAIMMLIRNDIIYKHQIKALKITGILIHNSIENGDLDWKKYYDKYNTCGTYNQMLWALTKWKYESFYPEIKNVET